MRTKYAVSPKGLTVLDVHPAADTAAIATPVATALPADVERRLAELVGLEPIVLPETADEPGAPIARSMTGRRHPLRRRGCSGSPSRWPLGGLLLVTAFAVLAARIGSDGAHVHPIRLAAWGIAAAVSAVSLSLAGHRPGRRRNRHGRSPPGARCRVAARDAGRVTGVVTKAGGVAGPAWVLFLPVVVVVGRGPRRAGRPRRRCRSRRSGSTRPRPVPVARHAASVGCSSSCSRPVRRSAGRPVPWPSRARPGPPPMPGARRQDDATRHRAAQPPARAGRRGRPHRGAVPGEPGRPGHLEPRGRVRGHRAVAAPAGARARRGRRPARGQLVRARAHRRRTTSMPSSSRPRRCRGRRAPSSSWRARPA